MAINKPSIKFFLFIIYILKCVLSRNTYSYNNDTNSIKIDAINNTHLQISLTGKVGTWTGIGFSGSMVGTDMNIIEFTDNNNYNLYDSFSSHHEKPKSDTDLGGSNDLVVQSFNTDANNTSTIVYQRKLDTGDEFDKVLVYNTYFPIVVAWGNGTMSFHGRNRAIATFNVHFNNSNTEDWFTWLRLLI
jgi:hypothetical protein